MECSSLGHFSVVARSHATNPRNHGSLEKFDGHARITGPCGDTMEFWLVTQNETVDRVSFITSGCAPSLACGSMATTLAEGRRIEDAAAVTQQDILNALGGLPRESEHCALLAATTLKAACEDCLNHQKEPCKDPGSAGQATCDTSGDKDISAFTRKKDEGDRGMMDIRTPITFLPLTRRK